MFPFASEQNSKESTVNSSSKAAANLSSLRRLAVTGLETAGGYFRDAAEMGADNDDAMEALLRVRPPICRLQNPETARCLLVRTRPLQAELRHPMDPAQEASFESGRTQRLPPVQYKPMRSNPCNSFLTLLT